MQGGPTYHDSWNEDPSRRPDAKVKLEQLLTNFRRDHPSLTNSGMFKVALGLMLKERYRGPVPDGQLAIMTSLVGTMLRLIADTVAKLHKASSTAVGSRDAPWQEKDEWQEQEGYPSESEWIVQHQLSSQERNYDEIHRDNEADWRWNRPD